MTDVAPQRRQFDERAAEEELERIRTALEDCRRRRNEAAESFDAFLRSFAPVGREPRSVDLRGGDRRSVNTIPGAPSATLPSTGSSSVSSRKPTPSVAPPVARPPTSNPPAPSIPEPAAALRSDRSAVGVQSSEPAEIVGLEAFDSQAALPPVAPELRRKGPGIRGLRREHAIIAAIGVVGGGTALAMWLTKSSAPEVAPKSDPPVVARPASPPPQPATTAQAVASNAFQLEVITTRRVWLRVIVDGERTMEQEVPADQRITLTPTQVAIIRAGDGGAVRVSVNGKDTGPFGTEGFPRTKTFSRPE